MHTHTHIYIYMELPKLVVPRTVCKQSVLKEPMLAFVCNYSYNHSPNNHSSMRKLNNHYSEKHVIWLMEKTVKQGYNTSTPQPKKI